jgi:tRNA pseudouridine13 synthase
MNILLARGLPNFFGSQRYGSQGNSHHVGAALLAGDYGGAVRSIIGSAEAVDNVRWREAIEAFHAGDLEESLNSFPGHCRTERDIVSRLLKRPGDWKGALKAVQPRLKMLYFSALQSALFDRVLAARLDSFDVVTTGDIACKHDNGACFMVEDGIKEAERTRKMEISPTGPLFGSRMLLPRGPELEIEERVLFGAGLTLDCFRTSAEWPYEGARRSLRVPVTEASVSEEGDTLRLGFSLPSGSYATTLLREVMKTANAEFM